MIDDHTTLTSLTKDEEDSICLSLYVFSAFIDYL